jgi:hypothetical protein
VNGGNSGHALARTNTRRQSKRLFTTERTRLEALSSNNNPTRGRG